MDERRNPPTGSGDRLRPTAACTVVTLDRLPAARVLAETFLEHHPGQEFVVLVVDGVHHAIARPGYLVTGHDWLDLEPDEYLRMATWRSSNEFVDAVKPLVLRQLLDHFEVAVYLAPETEVLAPFADVTRLAAEHEIVVTPYLLAPLPHDGREPSEERGGFDDGFLAVGQGARPFLDFWADRSRRRQPKKTGPEPEQHSFGAHWFDLIPGLFRHTVVRDPRLALGYWNLHERTLDGARFFHFSGYRPETPWLLSMECLVRPRVALSADSALRQLCDSYRNRLLRAGLSDSGKVARYGFAELPDGSPVTRQMRRLFHAAWLKAEQARVEPDPFGLAAEKVPPHPFGDDGGLAFQQWLSSPASPVEQTAGLNRLAMEVWASRVDLQAVFPEPLGRDAPGFRDWCSTHGAAEGLIPECALPREPAAVDGPVDEFGVNVAGYLTAELGIGEMGRIMLGVAAKAGIPVVSVVEDHSLSQSCRTALDEPETTGRPKFPVSLLALNSDYTQLLIDSHPEVGYRRYRIGLWAWELEDFPEHMHDGFALVDEVWTLSEFCRRAIAPHSPVPVKVIPVPVLDPGPIPRPHREAGASVQFLFAFDFNSTAGRKNPYGLVTAFQRAFGDRDDVRLVIKATNAHLHTAAAERLRYAIGEDQRIELLDRYLSVDELNALYTGSDAYVSLHRSEGFGLTVAEAMVRGMPVIATDYSSTREFFDDSVGWPIPYTLTEVGPGWVPYQEDAVWADPDLDVAAQAMRVVADDPAEARRRGEAAREYVLRTRSMDTATTWMRAQLRGAYTTWQANETRTDIDVAPPRAHLDRVRDALKWRVRKALAMVARRLDRLAGGMGKAG
jgi:glycosyltransferase involved in cell wall biosynthesis